MQQQELVRRFATWLYTLQPSLWKEVRHMAGTASGIFDWKAIVENSTPAELVQLIRALHVERFFDAVEWANLIEAVGLSKVIEAMGLPKVIDAVGLPKVIETVGLSKVIDAVGLSKVIETAGLSRVIDATGPEKVLDELLTHITAEQLQELLRRRQEKGEA
jgi:hypothetical protein